MDNPAFPRDEQGRFRPGNPGGPGRPPSQGKALRRAAEEAITTDHVAAIIRKAARMALEGDMTAARLVLDRTCGRTPEAPTEGVPIEVTLPRMDTAGSCNAALERLADAICMGTVDRDAARMLIDVIQTRLKAIEVSNLDDRLTELEKAAATVDFGGSRTRRF